MWISIDVLKHVWRSLYCSGYHVSLNTLKVPGSIPALDIFNFPFDLGAAHALVCNVQHKHTYHGLYVHVPAQSNTTSEMSQWWSRCHVSHAHSRFLVQFQADSFFCTLKYINTLSGRMIKMAACLLWFWTVRTVT